MVSCNPEEMETALRNLFENATLYSPSSPEIEITLRREGKRCHLTFKDKGKGIDPEHLKKVFRMFYRVRSHGENSSRDRSRTLYRKISYHNTRGQDQGNK